MLEELPSESLEKRKSRAKQIFSILKKTYPTAHIALNFTTPWELLVATILSAQCTDVMVNKVTEKLFKKYKTLDDYISANLEAFEQDIKSTGFYHNKAKNVMAAAKKIKEEFNAKVPNTMEDLLTLPGVARKTANIVLGNAYKVIVGIAVDTHVHRISQRLRLVDMDYIRGKKKILFKKNGKEYLDFKKDAYPSKIEEELMKVLPKDDWFAANYLIIDHGRAICKSQNPDCPHCPISELCPVSRV